jgi:arylsulfatase A-like enzyme
MAGTSTNGAGNTARRATAFLIAGGIAALVLAGVLLKVLTTRDALPLADALAAFNGTCKGCNVVLLTVDTLRADFMPCYGYGKDTTPGICGHAKKGLLFERAYSQAPRTEAALFSMMTGSLVANSDIMDIVTDSGRHPLLSERLKGKGYATAGFTDHPHIRVGEISQVLMRGYDTFENLGTMAPEATSRKLSDEVIRWLDSNRDRKFFLWAHFFDPHYPYSPLEAEEGRFGFDRATCGRVRNGMAIEELRGIEARLTPRELECVIGLYQAEVASTDRQVGRVIDRVSSLGLAPRTIVIVTSDHGEEFMERSRIGHEWTVYDELIRVPFIVIAPGGRPPARVEEPVGTRMIPSLVLRALEGVPMEVTPQVYSRSFHYYATTSGEQEFRTRPNEFTVISGDDKFILTEGTGKEEFYDLARDPGERRSDPGGARARALKADLESWMRRNTVLVPAAAKRTGTPENIMRQMEQLAGLGYVDH